MSWNAKYGLLLLGITMLTYIAGIIIGKQKERNGKMAIAISVVISLGILFYFKYINFALGLLGSILSYMRIEIVLPQYDILLPVGISFFTFQSIGYVIDVYRKETYAEKNFIKYALFVSFFPQLVAGPIERSKNLLKQLAIPQKFSYDNFREGFLMMLWGYFQKMVIADRIAIFVDVVYDNLDVYHGWYVIVATILFAFQIYCDFSGYSTIAIGAARILGISLMENFDAPYLATSVSAFWRRWHISLTSWFRDYVYIPLGGNRKGAVRKNLNILIVFFLSGLWHGASLAFVLWGVLNGLYQVVGQVIKPVKNRLLDLCQISQEKFASKIVKVVITFALVDFAWLFFRAGSISTAKNAILSMISINNFWILFDGSLYKLGLSEKNFMVLIISLVILLVVDLLKVKGVCVRKEILGQDYWFRCLTIIVAVISILIFGIWGNMEHNAGFIYFQF
ncbi:MAG: MBOAT family protein [Lachnospiraceae bacterium]|nr:MBOAT family protein [Lachnospiraceae bacterium]